MREASDSVVIPTNRVTTPHVTQDLKFDPPLSHRSVNFTHPEMWIFQLRYLDNYWKFGVPVAYGVGSHAEMFISELGT